MRRSILVVSLIASLTGLPVGASEGVELSAKAKSLAIAGAVPPAKQAEAPFTRGGRDPMPELLLRDLTAQQVADLLSYLGSLK